MSNLDEILPIFFLIFDFFLCGYDTIELTIIKLFQI